MIGRAGIPKDVLRDDYAPGMPVHSWKMRTVQ
jgi:hypothetical protein